MRHFRNYSIWFGLIWKTLLFTVIAEMSKRQNPHDVKEAKFEIKITLINAKNTFFKEIKKKFLFFFDFWINFFYYFINNIKKENFRARFGRWGRKRGRKKCTFENFWKIRELSFGINRYLILNSERGLSKKNIWKIFDGLVDRGEWSKSGKILKMQTLEIF